MEQEQEVMNKDEMKRKQICEIITKPTDEDSKNKKAQPAASLDGNNREEVEAYRK